MKKRTAVLVTTVHRGVFFGYASEAVKDKSITIQDGRNCIYWSADVKGFLGLAATGPSKSCKIGPKVSTLTLTDVTSVSEVSPEAVEQWEKAPWTI